MRVLMLSWEYPPNIEGGLGRHVAELSPALAEQQSLIYVVTPVSKVELESVSKENGVMVHRVFTPALDKPASIHDQAVEGNQTLAEYALHLAEQFDVIHVHDWLTSFAGLALQKAWRRPLVATIHATERGRGQGYIANDLQQAIDKAERDLIEQASHIIVCSRYMLNEVQAFFHTPQNRLDVVFNGVNIAELRNGSTKDQLAAFRAKYAAPDEQIVFAVARLVYQKGLHQLVAATPRILAGCPRTRVIIAGKGPEAHHLAEEALHLGVADRVTFVGFISDKERNKNWQLTL